MIHGQWKDSHDKKQAKGGLRHRMLANNVPEVPPGHKSKWFFDVFWGEYSQFVGLYRKEMRIDGRASKMLQFNVGPLHLAVEKWRAKKVKRYG